MARTGARASELAQMRTRLEREQGARNPLKAAPGGYYDIDFALMYLRLRSAGFFFKVLNTPERIDIVEKMGHLDREDALLLRDAATFYRAVDHGLRISTGHAEGRLPDQPGADRDPHETGAPVDAAPLCTKAVSVPFPNGSARKREPFSSVFSSEPS